MNRYLLVFIIIIFLGCSTKNRNLKIELNSIFQPNILWTRDQLIDNQIVRFAMMSSKSFNKGGIKETH
jgi:hypothetical protein